MTVLSGNDIIEAYDRRCLFISPFSFAQVQPASYDVLCGDTFLVPQKDGASKIDPYEDNTALFCRKVCHERFLLPSMGFVLAATHERVCLDGHLIGRVEGKSSLGRLGLLVHATAGFIDPGFKGNVTLELYNVAPWDIVLTPGMPIAQLSFSRLHSEAALYSGKYQDDSGPQASRYHLNARPTRRIG